LLCTSRKSVLVSIGCLFERFISLTTQKQTKDTFDKEYIMENVTNNTIKFHPDQYQQKDAVPTTAQQPENTVAQDVEPAGRRIVLVEHDTFKKVRIICRNASMGSYEEDYNFLVVAADPQDGLSSMIMKKTATEAKVFSPDAMKSFTFQTTLMKFPKQNLSLPVARYNPRNMDVTAGSAYCFRSETRKELSYLAVTNSPKDVMKAYEKLLSEVEYEYVTIYQLLDQEKHNAMNENQMWELLQKEMATGVHEAWFLYKWDEGKLIDRFHTKYFNYFTMDSLANKANNWDILRMQGQNNTIYVHASTAFESVLHIYEYIDMLWSMKRDVFPVDKQSRIAIVGAGPSGLLIARKLAKEGYSNITILEAASNNNDSNTKMLAGKTQTIVVKQLNRQIPAELGTCYLSPAYDGMIKDFQDSGLLEGQSRVSFDQGPSGPILREIVTADQFLEGDPVVTLFQHKYLRSPPPTMNFDDYAIWKGFDAHYAGKMMDGPTLEKKFDGFKLVVASAILKYVTQHLLAFGSDLPFPKRENPLVKRLFQQSVYEYLQENDMLSLLGTLQYGYSVQGYGGTAPDSTMPAFYLFMWITPPTLLTSLGNELKDFVGSFLEKEAPWLFKVLKGKGLFNEEPLVTAWTKGWGDVWRQLKAQFEEVGSGVSVLYDHKIEQIIRTGVA